MSDFSLTIRGLIVQAIGAFILNHGLTMDRATSLSEAQAVVGGAMILGGWLAAWYGRVRKGDITWYGKRIIPPQSPDGAV